MARKVVYNNSYFEVSDEANIIHIKDLKGGRNHRPYHP